jgi:hypothetical protein
MFPNPDSKRFKDFPEDAPFFPFLSANIEDWFLLGGSG